MKTRHRLLSLIAIACCAGLTNAEPTRTEANRVIEIELRSEIQYENPFTEIELDAIVIQPDLSHPVPASTGHITGAVRRILVDVERWSAAGIDRVRLFHNRQVSSSSYAPVTVRMLPVDFERFRVLEQEPWKSRGLPMYSMPRDALLAALLRQYFFVTIFRACAESIASENAARLAAMQAAEKSLGERRAELSGRLRSARQDQITAELLDVVAGYEATRTDARVGGPGA